VIGSLGDLAATVRGHRSRRLAQRKERADEFAIVRGILSGGAGDLARPDSAALTPSR